MDDDLRLILTLILLFWVWSGRRGVLGVDATEDMLESGPAPKGGVFDVQSMDGVFSWDAGD